MSVLLKLWRAQTRVCGTGGPSRSQGREPQRKPTLAHACHHRPGLPRLVL